MSQPRAHDGRSEENPATALYGRRLMPAGRVLVRPTDPARSTAFYRDVLGLAVFREFPGGTVAPIWVFVSGSGQAQAQQLADRIGALPGVTGARPTASQGDATLISVQQGQFDYVDVVGEHLIGDRKIVSEGVVIAGRWWHPKQSPKFRKLTG